MKKGLFFICCVVLIGIVALRFPSMPLIGKEEIRSYIQEADKLSEGKAQLNWKYLYAIDAVINKEEALPKEERLAKISDAFFQEDGNKYILNDLDTALAELGFTLKQEKKVNDMLEDLKFMGVKPERLRPDTMYASFIDEIKDSAVANYEKSGILPSITIAQAILESDWGRSSLAQDGNNLFGIKADRSWQGETVLLATKEYHDKKIDANFRQYETKKQSIDDHATFLMNNPRYEKHGVFNAVTYRQQAKALEEAGYSTAQNEDGEKVYASMLEGLITQYNLQLIDSSVQERTT
ncbi:MAG: glycoside hydrolase family 73 protein [Bacillaceae bacterium]